MEQWSLEIQQGQNLPCDEEPYYEYSTDQVQCFNCSSAMDLDVTEYFGWHGDMNDVIADRCEWPIQTITRELTSGGGPQTFVDIQVIIKETTTGTFARTATYSDPISVETGTFTEAIPTWFTNVDVTFLNSGIHTYTRTETYDPDYHAYLTESGWAPLETGTADATASSSVAETTEAMTSMPTSEAASEATSEAASESTGAGESGPLS